MYKIHWVGLQGQSGYIPDEYDDKKTAQDDAKMYNALYPGIQHKVEEFPNE